MMHASTYIMGVEFADNLKLLIVTFRIETLFLVLILHRIKYSLLIWLSTLYMYPERPAYDSSLLRPGSTCLIFRPWMHSNRFQILRFSVAGARICTALPTAASSDMMEQYC